MTLHQPQLISNLMENYGYKTLLVTWLAAEESKEKDIAAMKVAPKKRGRKAAAVAAPNKEEEETEKKPDAKRGRKATASVEEKREEEAPELAVPEPEVSSSTR